ncbi:hypothetical protein Pyn_15635 [Prunus yedoensis var. nudiflora]|uniref:Uncharacterized protein n=1 Tax=Prunus yedoensis var. nudiflora TaxID=2094558 RepID=A0A314Z5R3_PRUYE|nr:hypothetical protein Pyn_15635 [Prunus yedoensis var. nudiflora]
MGGGDRLRSNSKGETLRNDDVMMQSSPSSTTEDEKSQSLWQSSGRTGCTGFRCR